jgi:hypothetical protein
MKLILMSLSLLLAITLTSCTEGRSISPIKTEIEEDISNELNLINESVKVIYNPSVTLDDLKQAIKLNNHKDETIATLGIDYNIGYSDYESADIIRYDFSNEPTYKYQYSSVEESVGAIDVKGLLALKMKYQVFLYIQNEYVYRYSIAYTNKDGKVHLYSVNMDGSSKTDIYETQEESR